MAGGTFSLCGVIVVASDELIAIERVNIIPIRLAGAVIICYIIPILRRYNLRALSSRHFVRGNNHIEPDTRTCNRMHDEEGTHDAQQVD